jgi:hypothetical protein
MAGSDTFALEIRTAVIERLRVSDDFARAPEIVPLPRFTGDPDRELEVALDAAGRAGVLVTVSEPDFSVDAQGIGVGRFAVLIAEAPELNRGAGGTGRTAQALEDATLTALLFWTHALLIGSIFQDGPIDRPEEGAGMVRRIPFRFGVFLGTR